jgi:hypothetical protein
MTNAFQGDVDDGMSSVGWSCRAVVHESAGGPGLGRLSPEPCPDEERPSRSTMGDPVGILAALARMIWYIPSSGSGSHARFMLVSSERRSVIRSTAVVETHSWMCGRRRAISPSGSSLPAETGSGAVVRPKDAGERCA